VKNDSHSELLRFGVMGALEALAGEGRFPFDFAVVREGLDSFLSAPLPLTTGERL
jgi:hypothetical protein